MACPSIVFHDSKTDEWALLKISKPTHRCAKVIMKMSISTLRFGKGRSTKKESGSRLPPPTWMRDRAGLQANFTAGVFAADLKLKWRNKEKWPKKLPKDFDKMKCMNLEIKSVALETRHSMSLWDKEVKSGRAELKLTS